MGTPQRDDSTGTWADDHGNVYISGFTNGSLDGTSAGDSDAFISKYDSAGVPLWTRQLGTSAVDYAMGVAADTLGNVYLSGLTAGDLAGANIGSFDAFISKYDEAGSLAWTRQFGSTLFDWATGVATDGNGNVFVSGYTAGNLAGNNLGRNSYDAFIIKYDAEGTVLWRQQLGTRDFDLANGVALDKQGNIYLSGVTTGRLGEANVGREDAFLIKYVEAPEPGAFALVLLGSVPQLLRRRF